MLVAAKEYLRLFLRPASAPWSTDRDVIATGTEDPAGSAERV
jgi:hypothetical protein